MNIEDRIAAGMNGQSVPQPAAAPPGLPVDQHGDTPANHSTAYNVGLEAGRGGKPMEPPFGYQPKDLAAWQNGWAAGFAALTGGSAAPVPIFAPGRKPDEAHHAPAARTAVQPNPKYDAGIADAMEGLPRKPNASAEYNRGFDEATRTMANTSFAAPPKSYYQKGKESAADGDTFNELAHEEFKAGWKAWHRSNEAAGGEIPAKLQAAYGPRPEVGTHVPQTEPAANLDRSTFPPVEITVEGVKNVLSFLNSAEEIKPVEGDVVAAKLAEARKQTEAGWYAASRGHDCNPDAGECFREGWNSWKREYGKAAKAVEMKFFHPAREPEADINHALEEFRQGYHTASAGDKCGRDKTDAFRQGHAFYFRVNASHNKRIADSLQEQYRLGFIARLSGHPASEDMTDAWIEGYQFHYTLVANGLLLPDQTNQAGRVDKLFNLLEFGWSIIANAGQGNWENESETWRGAAERFRDKYHAARAEVTMPANQAEGENVLEIRFSSEEPEKSEEEEKLPQTGLPHRERSEAWLRIFEAMAEGANLQGLISTREAYRKFLKDVS